MKTVDHPRNDYWLARCPECGINVEMTRDRREYGPECDGCHGRYLCTCPLPRQHIGPCPPATAPHGPLVGSGRRRLIFGDALAPELDRSTVVSVGDAEMHVRYRGELDEVTLDALRDVCAAAYRRLGLGTSVSATSVPDSGANSALHARSAQDPDGDDGE